jgi:polyphosphate kinase
MIFHNGGSEEVFISSADLMTRNIEHRIEVTCPVFDKGIKNELKHIFDIQWKDNVKARVLDSTLSNNFIKPDKDNEVRSQVEVYEYIKKLKEKTSEK